MISLKVVTPRGVYMEKDVNSIHAKSTEGEFTLFTNHMPAVLALVPCRLAVTTENGESLDYAISGGFLQFADKKAILLTDAIEGRSEINIERAKAAYERARARLEKRDTTTNMKRSELALKRAINRLHVSETEIH